MIGVNDLDASINGDTNFTTQLFEEKYRGLLKKTKEVLPLVLLVLCEPFILPVGKVKEKLEIYEAAIK